MNKKSLVILCLVGFVLLGIGIIAIFINKPGEDDFVQWLSENYDVNCIDVNCNELELKNQQSESHLFWNADGYYDTSNGFLNMSMQTKRLYRNIEDPNLFFSIEVKGFFGGFKVIEFQQNNVKIKKL